MPSIVHTILRALLLSAVISMPALGALAQDTVPVLRPVTSSYTLEYGKAHIADTYLTPLHYRGPHYAFTYERDQAMRFNPQRWTMQLKLAMVFDHTKNPAKNATMANADLRASWDMMHRWRLPSGFTLGLGGGTSLTAGVLYLSRNGNNPASAKVGWTVDATGYAAWSGRIMRLPLTVRYQPTLPLTGVFFSPDYGQLYYQIALGEHDGLLHAAWPGNYFALDNLLTVDLHLGATSLRIGYHNNTFSSKVNNIVSLDITHAVVIGITTEWISLSPTSDKINAAIISSY
ncbi:MAG: DUF3316 domain-containing protein [Muribaculaceae bacterium]|nr:DUF3316 domain-containing protein [Muribaculaceae bacterium]